MNYDLIGLRARLRYSLNVEQISIYAVAKGSSVSPKVLGEFLADGPLDEQQAMYLHSWLHYQREASAHEIRRLVQGELVPLDRKFTIMRRELLQYGVSWYLPRHFMDLERGRQRIELKHMEERLKAEFLKVRREQMERWHLYFSDGSSYWQWKEKYGAYARRQAAKSGGTGPEGAGRGDDPAPGIYPITAQERAPRRFPWRGRP